MSIGVTMPTSNFATTEDVRRYLVSQGSWEVMERRGSKWRDLIRLLDQDPLTYGWKHKA
jgi:hypothetical protein